MHEKIRELEELRYENAEEARRLGEELLKEAPDDLYLLGVMGSIYRMLGKVEDALDILGEGIEIAKQGSDHSLTAKLYQRMTYTLVDFGRPEIAEGYGWKALGSYARAGNADGIGQCLYDIGVTFYFRQDFATTLELNESALGFLDENNDRHRFSALISSATCAARAGQLEDARIFLNRARLFSDPIPGSDVRAMEAEATILQQEADYLGSGKMRVQVASSFMKASRWVNAGMALLEGLECLLQGGHMLQSVSAAQAMLPTLIGHLSTGANRLSGSLLLEIWQAAMFAEHDFTLEKIRSAKKELQGLLDPGATRNEEN